jgi:proteasome lid subunit RPN8/RPN11
MRRSSNHDDDRSNHNRQQITWQYPRPNDIQGTLPMRINDGGGRGSDGLQPVSSSLPPSYPVNQSRPNSLNGQLLCHPTQETNYSMQQQQPQHYNAAQHPSVQQFYQSVERWQEQQRQPQFQQFQQQYSTSPPSQQMIDEIVMNSNNHQYNHQMQLANSNSAVNQATMRMGHNMPAASFVQSFPSVANTAPAAQNTDGNSTTAEGGQEQQKQHPSIQQHHQKIDVTSTKEKKKPQKNNAKRRQRGQKRKKTDDNIIDEGKMNTAELGKEQEKNNISNDDTIPPKVGKDNGARNRPLRKKRSKNEDIAIPPPPTTRNSKQAKACPDRKYAKRTPIARKAKMTANDCINPEMDSDKKLPAAPMILTDSIVVAEDEQLTTPYLYTTLGQYKRCTKEEKTTSKTKIGLACIHCNGGLQNPRGGHGSYFYSNVDSFCKNLNSHVYNHLLQCSDTPEDVKKRLKVLKAQCKYGSQRPFLDRIWGRLHGESTFKRKRHHFHHNPQLMISTVGTSVVAKEAPVELMLADDERLVSTYVSTVINQYKRCTFGPNDKKGFRCDIQIGFGGMECIHCPGPNPRKVFYSSSDSIRNNFAHLSTHLLECKGVPDTLKMLLVELKDSNPKQREDRKAFFNVLFTRLQGGSCVTNMKVYDMLERAEPTKTISSKKQNRAKGVASKGSGSKHQPKRTQKRKQGESHEQFLTNSVTEDSLLCKVVSTDVSQISYPHAPMAQLWLDKSFVGTRSQSDLSDEVSIDIHAGGTLIGRRYVWDEGYFVDQHHDVKNNAPTKSAPILRGCTCGADHSHHMEGGVESGSMDNVASSLGKARRSERSGGSIRTSTVLSKLADGTLSPHTLITCDEYTMGPELRFKRELSTENVQPFSIRVSPDALFIADLHAHLSESEIIGFLGGYYSPTEKCLFIQAAFPCKATDRIDAGDTDVEMDPVSQIYAREAISNHGLSVVGWYHSHPTFQPNPSVTDIENQASYQQLFNCDNTVDKNTNDSTSDNGVSPFVGLIIGTYDGQNPTSESVMRWFHVISKKADGKKVNFPMQLKTTHRHFRAFENDEVRPAMTSSGKDIRQELELKYLSCPITKKANSQLPSDDQGSGFDIKAKSVVPHSETAQHEPKGSYQKKLYDTPQLSDQISNGRIKSSDEGVCAAIMESNRPALLLSESLLESHPQGKESIKWKFKAALPLYFTEREKAILHMDADTISNDVFAGIIWHAVEREMSAKPSEHSLLPAVPLPPSPRAILELLLRLSLTGSDDIQSLLYEMIHSLEVAESESDNLSDEIQLDNIDAVISHKVDAMFSHYSSKQKKINPFKSWNGAGDKGKDVIEAKVEGVDGSKIPSASSSNDPTHYYMTEVLHMNCEDVNGKRVYKGGAKMKRGQKIASCLLRWARRMQLQPNFESVSIHNSRNEGGLVFDMEPKIMQKVTEIQNGYVFIVAEVMRLLAARWKETGTRQRVRRSPIRNQQRD